MGVKTSMLGVAREVYGVRRLGNRSKRMMESRNKKIDRKKSMCYLKNSCRINEKSRKSCLRENFRT